MSVVTEVQKLEPDAIVSLYILDTTNIGGSEIFRFTSMPDGDSAVLFDGEAYTPVDIRATGFNWDGRGTFPKPTLTVSNVSGLVTSAIYTLGDMVGAKFIRIRTFAKHLDNGSDPDPTATFPIEQYVVDQRTKHTKAFVEWKLASVIDQIGVKIPRRQCLRDACTHTYREYNTSTSSFDYTGATCPYVGSGLFTEDNVSTADPTEDSCGRKVSSCKLRFGANGVLPTRSFPGISRVRT